MDLAGALAPHVDSGALPGVVAAVDGPAGVEILALGRLGPDDPRPMRGDTPFRIASMTKPIAAVLALMLVEEGRLALDEPVDPWLPELAARQVLRVPEAELDDTVPAERPILVRDLFTLTLGIGGVWDDRPIARALAERGLRVGPGLPEGSGDAWIASLGALPLMHQPGAAWLYDTGLVALGVLIERAGGRPLAAQLAERLFAPLGMAATGFSLPPQRLEALPPCLEADGIGLFDPGGAASRFARAPGFPSAAAGLVSTAADLIAFARLMRSGGLAPDGRRLIGAGLLAEMRRDQLTPAQKAAGNFAPQFWDKRGWGLGLGVMTDPGPADPAGCGWDGGYGTSLWWSAEGTGLLLTQRLLGGQDAPPVFQDFWCAVRAGAGRPGAPAAAS